jgi:hypothetical protein
LIGVHHSENLTTMLSTCYAFHLCIFTSLSLKKFLLERLNRYQRPTPDLPLGTARHQDAN